MLGRRSAAGWALVVVWRCFSLTASAQTPDAPPERAFFRAHPVLQFIEQRLPPSATTVVPPDAGAGRHVVTDLDLRVAFAGVLDDFLTPPSTFAGKAGDLIGEVCRYRPAQTAQWIAVAADSILTHSLPSAEQDLNDAVAAAIAANPREAGAVVRQTMRRLAAGIDAGDFRAAGRFDRETAARLAGRIVLTGIKTVKTAPRIRDLVEHALEEALAQPANDFVVETMAAAVRGGQGVEGARVADLAKLAFSKFGQRGKLPAAMICAGLIKGSGVEAASAIKDEAALSLPVALSAFANITCSAYLVVAAAPPAAPFEISRFITVTNADYIPAAMIGAIVAAPRAASEILQAGLNRDLVLRGRATTRDIVEAAVLAGEQEASELAAAAVGHGDLQEGNAPAQIAEGLVRGAPVARIGVALAAQLGEQEKSAAAIKATVAGAMTGAIAAEKWRAVSTIAFAAAADPKFAGDVLDQVMISAPRDLQYAGVLGVLAARPEQASALLDRALKHGDLAAGQGSAIAAGGAAIIGIQTAPDGFFHAAAQRFGEKEKVLPELVEAIVLGTALANPRGAPAVTAAAVAATEVPAARLIATALQGDASAAVRIVQSVESAGLVKSEGGSLFSLVRRRLVATPAFAPEIVTGAMAAAPRDGHLIGHAAALAAPAAIPQMVPRLFAFSPENDFAETFVALTSGVTRGVVEARLEPAAESSAVAETVAAAIRSVVAISRRRAAATAVLPEGASIAAVVGAATRAASGHSIEIAQVAARTARVLSCPADASAVIKDAVLAADPRADAAKVADAVAAGIAEAKLQVPAAGVKALLDYAHDSLTGQPMTSFHDL